MSILCSFWNYSIFQKCAYALVVSVPNILSETLTFIKDVFVLFPLPKRWSWLVLVLDAAQVYISATGGW